MDCDVIHVEQTSDAWDELRRCRITGSRLGDACADKQSKRYKKLRQRLILETSGAIVPEPDGPWFDHGREMEPRAIGAYEYRYGQPILHNIMLISHKHNWLSVSPDGMLHDFSEGHEFKCRKIYNVYKAVRDTAIRAEREGKYKHMAPAEHRHQIQGAMWVTGLEYWWYCNYFEDSRSGDRKLHRALIRRDNKMIAEMERRCVQLMNEVYQST
jgi:hypothetical protein